MPLISMKRTPEEMKELAEEMRVAEPMGHEEFPYGLCITLTDAELAKMGWTAKPEAGAVLKIEAMGFVRRIEASADEEGEEPDVCCHIQITDMGMTEGKKRKSAAESLYGAKDD